MNWRKFISAKQIAEMEKVKPISPEQFRKAILTQVLPMGAITILASLLMIHFNKNDMTAESVYLLCIFFIVMLPTSFLVQYRLKYRVPGRLRSIDPEIIIRSPMTFASIQYSPTSYLFYCILLCFARPRSLTGKLTNRLKWVCRIHILIYISIFLSFASIALNTNSSKSSPQNPTASYLTNSAYHFLGPSIYFITELTSNVSRLTAIKNKKIASPEKFLAEAAAVCKVPSTHKILLQVMFLKQFNKHSESKAAIPFSEKIKIMGHIIQILDNCDHITEFPAGFNPATAFQLSGAIEGALILMINSAIKVVGEQEVSDVLSKKLIELQKNLENKGQVEKLITAFNNTRFYKSTKSIQNSFLKKWL